MEVGIKEYYLVLERYMTVSYRLDFICFMIIIE